MKTTLSSTFPHRRTMIVNIDTWGGDFLKPDVENSLIGLEQ